MSNTDAKSAEITATITMENVGGRMLRVARWRLDEPSEHPPILFFNGIGANIEAVSPLAEALDDRGFIMFDMPGVGESPDPTIPYNPFTMSWITTKLLDRFGVDTVDVIGISWGGAMAQHYTLQHANRVRKLVLVATTAGMLMVPGNPAALSKMTDPRRYVDADFMAKHFQTLYGGELEKSDNKSSHISRLKPPSPRGYMYQLLCMLGWTSAPALPFMKKETLIMMGDDDQIVVPMNGKFLNSLIPNSRLYTVKGGGHLFLLTHADESIAELKSFLDEPAITAAEAA